MREACWIMTEVCLQISWRYLGINGGYRHHPRYQNETLRWRHNDRAGVSNHQPHGCLLNRLFRRKSKKTSKLRVTGLCVGNSPGTGEFPAQMASYAENVSIWWRHHENNAYNIHTFLFSCYNCSSITIGKWVFWGYGECLEFIWARAETGVCFTHSFNCIGENSVQFDLIRYKSDIKPSTICFIS